MSNELPKPYTRLYDDEVVGKFPEWLTTLYDEPDVEFWIDKGSGYPCVICRDVKNLKLRGHVGVPEGHPAYHLDTSRVELINSENSKPFNTHDFKSINMVHVAGDGTCEITTKGYWWFEFLPDEKDFCPRGDNSPGVLIDQYRSMGWNRVQCENLAAQLKCLELGEIPKLGVFADELAEEWTVAWNALDAAAIYEDEIGQSLTELQEETEKWVRLPDDRLITITSDDGDEAEGELFGTRTCAEWAKLVPRGLLCSGNW